METFYINPITERTIKKNSKTYSDLKSRHFKLKKSPCLFNEKAAKKCLKKINKYYPNLPVPLPSKTLFNDITVIRNETGEVHGVVSENGQMYKLEYPIKVEIKVPELITVSDNHREILNNKLNSSDIIGSEYIKDKIDKINPGENVMYNPLHDNYIQGVVTEPILKEINNKVIPETLPVTGLIGVSGVIRNKDNLDEITGYINEKNQALKLTSILNSKVSELQKKLNTKNSEINELKKEIQEKINSQNKEIDLTKVLNKLNAELIKKENEKEKLEKQHNLTITKLMTDIGRLNTKIPQLEESINYYYSLIKRTLEKWNPIEDDPLRYKDYGSWLKALFFQNKKLKKTDNIEQNLDVLVERANMYANSKRKNIELQKVINQMTDANNTLKYNNKNLRDELIELSDHEDQINKLKRELNNQYTNSQITRDTLIKSYEQTIKEYKDKLNNLNTTYNKKELENTISDLQQKLKDNSNEKIINNLDRYKKAFREIQTKYNNLININKLNLEELKKESDNLSNVSSELTRCKEEKIRKEKELSEYLSNSISLPRSVTDKLPSENALQQESIKQELKNCSGYLTNEFGVKSILKWNEDVQKCTQEEIKCNENEMYNDVKQKCVPCEEYNLIWDPITQKCTQAIPIGILVDQNDNIIGESDDNWTEVRRKSKKSKKVLVPN